MTSLVDVLATAAGRVSAVVTDAVGRLRHGRPLHPAGVVLAGRVTRDGTARTGARWLDEAGDDQVVVRLSRGGGLPAPLPDVHGLALRLAAGSDGVTTADVLLSSGARPVGLRHVPVPRLRPGRGLYGSLMPYRTPSGPVLVAAEADPSRALPADLTDLALELAVEPLELRLLWARPTGAWAPFGRLTVGGRSGTAAPVPAPGEDAALRFDPADTPPGLAAYGWAARFRGPSYAAARRHPARTARHPRPPRPRTTAPDGAAPDRHASSPPIRSAL